MSLARDKPRAPSAGDPPFQLLLLNTEKQRMVQRWRRLRRNQGQDGGLRSSSSERWVVTLVVLALTCCVFTSINGIIPLASASSPISPVANWDPSWAASSAQGTTVVVAFDGSASCQASARPHGDADDDSSPNNDVADLAAVVARDRTLLDPLCGSGCVVLMRSTSPPTPGSSLSSTSSPFVPSVAPPRTGSHASGVTAEQADEARGTSLPLLQRVDAGRMVVDRVTRRWAWMPPTVLVAMTGLASDVDHLLSTLQSEWDSHVATYEGSDHALSPHRVATVSLAQALYGADGGRPYGVQCLVVGPTPIRTDNDDASSSSAPNRKAPSFGMFTLDPGGGYRHWGVATAIGRAADRVRRNVHEILTMKPQGSGGLPEDAGEALRVALNATASALGDNDDGKDGSGAHYTALVLVHRGNGHAPLMAIVDPLHIQATLKELKADKASKQTGSVEGMAA
jgi:hypothetical protein